MSDDFITSKDDRLDGRLYAIFAANFLLVGLTFFGWALIYPIVAGPLRWGTGTFIGSHAEPFDYPINVLWAVPIVAMVLAWILRIEGQRSRAITLAAAPLMFLTILVICYHAGFGTFN